MENARLRMEEHGRQCSKDKQGGGGAFGGVCACKFKEGGAAQGIRVLYTGDYSQEKDRHLPMVRAPVLTTQRRWHSANAACLSQKAGPGAGMTEELLWWRLWPGMVSYRWERDALGPNGQGFDGHSGPWALILLAPPILGLMGPGHNGPSWADGL